MTADQIIDYLRNGFESARMAHAYILDVPSVEAGKDLAVKAVSIVFCLSENKPCGVCTQCVSVKNRTHPDVWWMEPEKKSRQIAVEQIRDGQKMIFQTSFSGGWKACVLVSADRLTGEASNAFLKTLEEPPAKTVFFLVTDSSQGLISTIVSRCQRVVMSGSDTGLHEGIHRAVADILLSAGRVGGVAGTLAVADSMMRLLGEMKDSAEEEEKSLRGNSAEETRDEDVFSARVNARYREKRSALMRFLAQWYRDILVLSIDPKSDLIYNEKERDLLAEMAGRVSPAGAVKDIETISDMERQLNRNVSEQTVFLSGLGRITI